MTGAPTDPSARVYYAQKSSVGNYYNSSPNEWWVKLFGGSDPIVEVRIRERVEGDLPSTYWAWLSTEEPDRYQFVWHTELQFEVCFQYGSFAESSRSKGRKVNVVVEEIQGGPEA